MVIKLLIITVLCVVLFVLLRFIHLLFPVKNMVFGSKVNVYINGSYNRTATVSHNLPDGIVILDKIMIPVHYRGKFYTVGYMDDGKIMISHTHWDAYLAHVAEFIRKIVDTPEYEDPTVENASGEKEEVEDEE